MCIVMSKITFLVGSYFALKNCAQYTVLWVWNVICTYITAFTVPCYHYHTTLPAKILSETISSLDTFCLIEHCNSSVRPRMHCHHIFNKPEYVAVQLSKYAQTVHYPLSIPSIRFKYSTLLCTIWLSSLLFQITKASNPSCQSSSKATAIHCLVWYHSFIQDITFVPYNLYFTLLIVLRG